MNSITPLYELITTHHSGAKTRAQEKDFWHGADITITSRQDHPGIEDRHTIILDPNAPEIIAALEEVLPLLMEDEAIGYDYMTKYPIIAGLLSDLPDEQPGLELLRRALDLALKAHGRILYFAYGSNMDRLQMTWRCPKAEFLGTTRISGFEFLINSRSVASIRAKTGATVEGAVYAATADCMKALDSDEGTAQGLYLKEQVTDALGLRHEAYFATDSSPSYGKRSDYLLRILDAAKALGISEQHRSWIEGFKNKGAQ